MGKPVILSSSAETGGQPCGSRLENTGTGLQEEARVLPRSSNTPRSFSNVPLPSNPMKAGKRAPGLAARRETGFGFSPSVCWHYRVSGSHGDVWACDEVIDSVS